MSLINTRTTMRGVLVATGSFIIYVLVALGRDWPTSSWALAALICAIGGTCYAVTYARRQRRIAAAETNVDNS